MLYNGPDGSEVFHHQGLLSIVDLYHNAGGLNRMYTFYSRMYIFFGGAGHFV